MIAAWSLTYPSTLGNKALPTRRIIAKQNDFYRIKYLVSSEISSRDLGSRKGKILVSASQTGCQFVNADGSTVEVNSIGRNLFIRGLLGIMFKKPQMRGRSIYAFIQLSETEGTESLLPSCKFRNVRKYCRGLSLPLSNLRSFQGHFHSEPSYCIEQGLHHVIRPS